MTAGSLRFLVLCGTRGGKAMGLLVEEGALIGVTVFIVVGVSSPLLTLEFAFNLVLIALSLIWFIMYSLTLTGGK